MSSPINKTAPTTPSVAVFCPSPTLADSTELDRIRDFMKRNKYLQKISEALLDFVDIWERTLLNIRNTTTLNLSKRGDEYAQGFRDWINTGTTEAIASGPSTMVSLPMLALSEICQYLEYLELSGQTHAGFLSGLSTGGVQGYCGGLVGALAVASAKDEDELVTRASNCLRAAFVVGFYISDGEDGPHADRPTTLIVRLKNAGQHDELVAKFPGIYVAAITDPKSICFAGTEAAIAPLAAYVEEQGIIAQHTYPTGSGHNPANKPHLAGLLSLLAAHDTLALPTWDQLQVPVLSNFDGEPLRANENVAENILGNVVAGRCEWWTVMTKLAQRLQNSGSSSHSIVIFGNDCVPVAPFRQASLSISKIDVFRTVREMDAAKIEFLDDAVAIVGAGCRLPGANSLDNLWDLIAGRRSMCQEMRQDRVPLDGSFRGSLDPKFMNGRKFWANHIDDVEGFDHEFFGINRKEAQYMDPQQRLLLEVTYEALEESGYLGHRNFYRQLNDNVGCFIGATVVEYGENTASYGATAYTATGTLQSYLCGRLSYYFGWKGPSETFDTACSSSLVAINRAIVALRAKECKLAVAGGSNVLGSINLTLDLAKARFLSPTGQCKPFDRDADGYCRSDGVGIVVLKMLKDAVADGDPILGVVPATGTNQGALAASITLPDQRAQVELFRRNLSSAGLEPGQVSYVECHGTGTQAGDPSEVGGMLEVFGQGPREKPLYIGSIKGNIGHSEPTAGVAGLLKVLAMLKKGKIPPQASFRSVNPRIPHLDPKRILIPTKLEAWDAPKRIAMVNSYGAGGSNASLLCCEYSRAPTATTGKEAGWWLPNKNQVTERKIIGQTGDVALPVLVTGFSMSSLAANCKELAIALQSGKSKPLTPLPSVEDVLFTMSEKRQRHAFRFATTVSKDNMDHLISALEEASSFDPQTAAQDNRIKKIPSQPKHVVLAFGGQSQQAVHIDKEVYDANIRLREYIDQCQRILVDDLGYDPIIPAIFDKSATSQDVVLLQTALFILEYSWARCWVDAGLKVDVVIGHSFGELVALVFAGTLSLVDGLRAVTTRASLIKSSWGPESGSMLAIHASKTVVRAVIDAVDGQLEIACYNSENSHVIVGTEREVAAAEALLAIDKFPGVKYQRVKTTHGFHSRFAEGILPGLRELEKSLEYQEPKVRLQLCMGEHGRDGVSIAVRGHIARHSRDPVFFGDAVKQIEKEFGACAWIEAGIDSPIVPMVKKAVTNVGQHSFHPLKLQASSGTADPQTAFSKAVVGLWHEGIDVTFLPWLPSIVPEGDGDSGSGKRADGPRLVDLPRYQFSRTVSWVPTRDHAANLQSGIEEATETIRRLQKQLDNHVTSPQPNDMSAMSPKQLVTPLSHDKRRFSIDTGCERFQKIIASHSVRSRPLCPASLYLECVTMAVKLTLCQGAGRDIGPFPSKNMDLVFAKLAFENMLGTGTDREVSVLLEPEVGQQYSWSFIFESRPIKPDGSGGKEGRSTIHARGKVRQEASPDRRHLSPLLGERMDQIRNQPDAETLRTKRIYSLFTSVVDYDPLMRGLDSMVVSQQSFTGTIKTPRPVLKPEESSVIDIADACVIDNFIQPLGLAVNTGDLCNSDCAFLFSGCESFTLSSLCRLDSLEKAVSWSVVGSFKVESDRLVEGDIFLQDQDGRVVVTVFGARFNKLPLKTIESLLDRLQLARPVARQVAQPNIAVSPVIPTRTTVSPQIQVQNHSDAAITSHTSSGSSTPPRPVASQNHNANAIRQLVSSYVGVPADDLSPDITLSEMGLDSLAIIEFTDDCNSILKKEFSPDDLLETTLRSLLESCQPDETDHITPKATSITNARVIQSSAASVVKNEATITPALQPATPAASRSSAPSSTDAMQRIREIVANHCGAPAQDINASEPLSHHGIDSLAIIELLDDVQEAFGVAIDNGLVDLNTTPEEIVNIVSPQNGTVVLVQAPVAGIEQVASATYNEASQPASVTPGIDSLELRDRVFSLLSVLCGEVTKDTPLSETLAQLGIDSLAGEELKSSLEAEFDWCPNQDFATSLQDVTIGELLDSVGNSPYINKSSTGTSTTGTPTDWDSATSSDGSLVTLMAKTNTNGTNAVPRAHARSKPETFVFKKVGKTSVEADVYLPVEDTVRPMAVGILIHGGAHMALSKATVPPAASTCLLENGVLPVSVNYRLCPEVSLTEGPMEDIIDAYRWILNKLPALLQSRGIRIDTSKVVAVGWSSGGHLAAALSWQIQDMGLQPLKAILAFYTPLNWATDGETARSTHDTSPKRAIPKAGIPLLKKLVKNLPRTPITSYDEVLKRGFATDFLGMNWVTPNDPRSHLIAGIIQHVGGPCLPLLLNGVPPSNDDASLERALAPVEMSRVEAICPVTQARKGRILTPTFLIHGANDDVVPVQEAIEFQTVLQQQGVECNLHIAKAGHCFDVPLRYASKAWDIDVRPGFDFLLEKLVS